MRANTNNVGHHLQCHFLHCLMALEQRNDFFSSSTLFASYCAFLNNRMHLVQLTFLVELIFNHKMSNAAYFANTWPHQPAI